MMKNPLLPWLLLLALALAWLVSAMAGGTRPAAAAPAPQDPGHYIETKSGRTFTRDGRVYFIAKDTREITSDSDPARAAKFLASGDYRPAEQTDIEWMDAKCQAWSR